MLQLEEEVLGAAGASVRLARTAAQAMEILKQQSVDAVVCDAKLSSEDSVTDLYALIEKMRPELISKILFTVSGAGEEDLLKFLRGTGCPVLRKPFQIEEFLAAVKSVLSVPVHSPARI